MPRSSNDKTPLSYVRSGNWPDARLDPEAPLSAYCGLVLARDLATMMAAAGLSLRAVGERAGVAHSTIARILGGEVLPDIGTLARLEDALDHQLWPGPKALRAAAAQHGRCIA
ncbi:helix-turn-helix domain-containing protein [Kitasatospora sp. NPDC098663]|uniref:helix-turn-helix domain-containing protein n=1 Tax=Kitasatospora sp. NPDC098663 TaxID=3364096 RepID=UPI003830571A